MIDEILAKEIFEFFSEDLDKKIKKSLIKMDHNGYYSIVTQQTYSSCRPMYHNKNDIYKYSYSDLYEEMCCLFDDFESEKKDALGNIFSLKNFINYKMTKERIK